MKIKPKLILFFTALVLLLGSCQNRSIMFRAPVNYEYAKITEQDKTKEYRIGLNDRLQIFMLPNNANIMFENIGGGMAAGGVGGMAGGGMAAGGMAGGGGGGGGGGQFLGIVEFDGTIKLPTIGRIYVNNLTVRELELLLEETFKKYFVDPFVTVTAVNRRILVFPGSGGNAQVLGLVNPNTSLLEAIASLGGISGSAKAHKVILIRNYGTSNQKVFRIDFSKLDYLSDSHIILQANDIIYIEPINNVASNFLVRISPFIALLNFLLLSNRLLNLNLI